MRLPSIRNDSARLKAALIRMVIASASECVATRNCTLPPARDILSTRLHSGYKILPAKSSRQGVRINGGEGEESSLREISLLCHKRGWATGQSAGTIGDCDPRWNF